MSARKKRVEAWAVCWSDGTSTATTHPTAWKKGMPLSFGEHTAENPTVVRVVRLTEADPTAAALVRAAVKWAKDPDRSMVADRMLLKAVSRHLRKRR